MNIKVRDIIRALRLPFASASVLPFIFGSLIGLPGFNKWTFLLGFAAALFTHLSANLMNDYADSKSGADWNDRTFYPFFGGSKLIQDKVFSEAFYHWLAVLFALFGGASIIALLFMLKSFSVLAYYLLIIFLGWSYSAQPLQFSYNRCGEFIIFILFGPAVVMGAYYIQTGVFPAIDSFVQSLPFGFFTTAILYSNEIPDYRDDQKAGKHTWVEILGQKKAYIIYDILIAGGFGSILLSIFLGYRGTFSILAFCCIGLTFKATRILRLHFEDKRQLMESSKLTIITHALVSVVLIFDALL